MAAATTKRMRPAEPFDIPGSFPERSKVHRQSLEDWQSPARDNAQSGEGGEWLASLLLTPIRLAKSWLTGSLGAPVPATPTPAQRNKDTHRAPRRQHIHGQVRRANETHGGLPQQQQQQQQWRKHQARMPGSARKPDRRKSLLRGSSGGRHSSRRSRTIGLVHEYTTRPGWMADGARPEWLGPPSAGTSTAAYDSTPAPSQATADDGRADTRSILSVDSSLGFRDTVPLWQSGRVLSPSGSDATTGLVAGAWRRGPAAASGAGKAAGGSGAAEAWLAQLRKKIEDALSVSYPAAVVATSAYDRLRQREESFDERLEKARQQTAFALPANAAEVLKRAAAAGFVVELNNVPVTAHDMATLQDGKWLNDEVINFYMQLIMDRSAKTPALPRVHAFNTFFYSTLCESGYARVRRWTRRTKLFEKDLVIVPVHLGVHWCCAVIDLRQKSIVYYDALLGDDPGCLQTLMGYIRDESRDKCGADIDESEWTLRCDKRIPRQQNGYDCGVFAVMFAEYASRDAPFQFSQENCPFLRRRVTYEIATVSLTPAIA